MVGVDGDCIFGNARDEERDLPALIVVSDDLHPGGQLRVGREQVARDFLRFTDPRPVALFGRYGGFDGLALGDAFELFFETRNDVLGTVKIEQRATIFGPIDDFYRARTRVLGNRSIGSD